MNSALQTWFGNNIFEQIYSIYGNRKLGTLDIQNIRKNTWDIFNLYTKESIRKSIHIKCYFCTVHQLLTAHIPSYFGTPIPSVAKITLRKREYLVESVQIIQHFH
jgi:hypothetical protein